MSRTLQTIQNRNRIEKEEKQKKKDELDRLREESHYRATLHHNLETIDTIFADEEIKSIIIHVPEKQIPKFMRAIYSEDMAQYSIEQISALEFRLKRKMINF